jgi:hypothetical protein
MAVNIAAVLFGVLMTVNLIWPRPAFYGPAWYQQYIAVIFVPAVAIIGAIYYMVRQRRRPAETLIDEPSLPLSPG